MTAVSDKKFNFSSLALTTEDFDVVQFSGTEGLSKLYRFEITLASDNSEIDMEKVIQARAVFTILRPEGNISFHGIITHFEQKETAFQKTFYQAVLAPAFWRHTLTQNNQVFLGKTVPEIIEGALDDLGMTNLDYELRLTKDYPQRDYVCQYNESHYNFITRWIEHEGMYFFFEQGETREKLIVIDHALAHAPMAQGRTMIYAPPAGLDDAEQEEVITSLVCRQGILPARILLKDFNYHLQDVEMTAQAPVSDKGIGDVYIYGEHFIDQEEGDFLAGIRAQELKCRAQTFHGESLVPYLRPGYTFEVEGHNRNDFNTSYLTTDVEHRGSQFFYLTAGLGYRLEGREEGPAYRNSFSAISAGLQFRPERIASRPLASSTIHAHIDAESSGKYAELDDQGRYKVKLPFDLNGAKGGKASHWLRMAQPYAGNGHGMHFPLHKGTEILLTFIDGNVDRPVIAAAVPNPITISPVTSANSTQARITTSGGNKVHFEDQQ
ncbi:MAG: type VI secretion system tip protein VgrG, partial [Deltaproteobacteria bacterium]|nr:type VI secretion system tip protein VgrG [Deltaproteobacteria bacterium]